MKSLSMFSTQLRYINKAFWRNPASAFFTFAFPLMFLVIFTSLLGHGIIHLPGRQVTESTYYVAAMAAFAVITACYSNIAIGLAVQRDTGVLKRTRGTPISNGVYIASRLAHALFVALMLVAITAAFGRLFYHAEIPTGLALLRFLVVLIVGAVTFSALGVAVTSAVPNADAAPAIANATMMPLLFLSGIFLPLGTNAPAWLVWIARIFPVRHFAAGMQSGFLGTTFNWSDVGILALWGVAGILIARRFFSWEPRVS